MGDRPQGFLDALRALSFLVSLITVNTVITFCATGIALGLGAVALEVFVLAMLTRQMRVRAPPHTLYGGARSHDDVK